VPPQQFAKRRRGEAAVPRLDDMPDLAVARILRQQLQKRREIRLVELLGRRELSITEIALACGFSNATRFGVAFRKSFGTTPRAFRKTIIAD